MGLPEYGNMPTNKGKAQITAPFTKALYGLYWGMGYKAKLTVLTAFLTLSVSGNIVRAEEIKEIPSRKFEQIKAYIIDPTPEQFTVDVYSLANFLVDQDAPEFAIYISTSAPKICADFRDSKLSYEKPKKYLRKFDLPICI